MRRRHTAASIKKVRDKFLQVPIACGAAIIVIHLMPKDPADQGIRLLMTVAYFAAVLCALYYMTKPREAYMQQLFEWRFEDCGPVMEQVWKLYLLSLNRAIRIACYIAMAFVACCALSVLSKWPAFSWLSDLSWLYGFGWWITLAGLVLLPLAGGNILSEVMQRHQVLAESMQTSSFKAREVKDLQTPQNVIEKPPVLALETLEFHAGGFDWSWEDFYKNSIIFGQSGTGKTVCVLNALLEGLLASAAGHPHPPSGLILDPKGDFLEKIGVVCRKYGRQDDLLVLDPDHLSRSIRWNPFDSEDDELEVAARFGAVLESTGQAAGQNDAFWIDSAKKFIRHAIALVRLTNDDGEPPSFWQINELATDVRMKRISERADLLPDDGRGDQALIYFDSEWSELADNTRSSIVAYITNMIDPFLMEPYMTAFSGQSDFRVSEMVEAGKILYVYMPIAHRERMSRVISTFVKLDYYREVLKRPNKKRPSFFLCDEFQAFFTTMPGKGDADFFERSRQSNHANVIATQNYPALLKQAADKESTVKNLLGNCAVKMFLRNTDEMTNKYASELFGQEIVTMMGSGMAAASARHFGGTSTQSANRQYDYKVRGEEFVNLAVPSKRDGIDFTETIVHLASRGFVTKEKLKWKVHPLTG